ncbi:MAG: SAM-dependent methyltransferase [Acidobacteria bacterium]|nr:SAM-dependent methyltransferase [Acidobacteriota bacterium]
MRQQIQQQKLPSDWAAREALREKGQFWTPPWVAEAMIAYCLADDSESIFDPAVGAGVFFVAAREIARKQRRQISFFGAELDLSALQQAANNGLSARDLAQVVIGDFVLRPPDKRFPAIVANPPYIRHHRLSASTKESLRALSVELIGKELDGRAGLHIYFLLRALQLLSDGGRLAFIVPADTCEGVFARTLWRWITSRYRLDAVVTFTPEASPFPNVDTNPIILLIRNARPEADFLWAQCRRAGSETLREWIEADFDLAPTDALTVHRRDLQEGLDSGLSRPPSKRSNAEIILADFASVMRGIATGANEFFFLTRQRATELKIPAEMLLPAIGRTRDATTEEITQDTLRQLEAAGRPTLLFAPDGRELDAFPEAARIYLQQGRVAKLDQRPLIATRRPWYKMEIRKAPPFLFAYLGRRNARFIRNLAGVMPLTSFLCVYPHSEDADSIARIWQALKHPDTVKNLALVGKSYGSGAIKVEPRALERLPIPEQVIAKAGLLSISQQALSFYN